MMALVLGEAAAFSGDCRSSRLGTKLYVGPKSARWASQLNYQDGHSDDIAQKGWFGQIFATPPEPVIDETSQKVDEYLEFLDRRYHRLHDVETVDASQPKFSAWKWLMNTDKETVTLQEQDDALYALGVAGLASQKLLQKKNADLHLPSVESLESATINAHTVDVAATPDASVNSIAATLVAPIAPVLYRLSVQRRLLIEFQSRHLKQLAALILKNTVTAPVNAAKSLWRLGGGGKNVATTLALATALFFVFVKPVGQIMVSGGPSGPLAP